jgi:transcriptional regulator NrdR family protein
MFDGKVPCPFCEHGFSRTLYTRERRRRRECVKCNKRFTTIEMFVAERKRTADMVRENYQQWELTKDIENFDG